METLDPAAALWLALINSATSGTTTTQAYNAGIQFRRDLANAHPTQEQWRRWERALNDHTLVVRRSNGTVSTRLVPNENVEQHLADNPGSTLVAKWGVS